MASQLAVQKLQQRISAMQPLRLHQRTLPTPEALASLFPGGALREGGVYTVQGSWQLALACISELSRHGTWCGIIGCPEFGAEAAARLDIALERCVLVPTPGAQALSVIDTLSGTLGALVIGSLHRLRPHDAERIAARLRERGAILITVGDWSRPDTHLRVTGSQWAGLGAGYGVLTERELTVESHDQRGVRTHIVRFARGALAAAPPRRTVTR